MGPKNTLAHMLRKFIDSNEIAGPNGLLTP